MKLTLALLLSFNAFSISIASYNIRNFDHDRRMGKTDYAQLKQTLVNLNADIIGLQEIRMTRKFRGLISSTLPNYKTVFTNCGGRHYQYVGFAYNTKAVKLLSFKTDERTSNPATSGSSIHDCYEGSRPLGIAKFERLSDGKKFVAITTHLKSGGAYASVRVRQLNLIIKVVNEYRRRGMNDFVLLGDFNTTNYKDPSNNYHKLFNKFAEITKTYNTTKDIGCTSYWWGGVDDGLQYPSHLDHILVSKSLFSSGVKKAELYSHCQQNRCEIVPEGSLGRSYGRISDHCPIKVTL